MLCTIKQNAIKVSALPNLPLVGQSRNIHHSSGVYLCHLLLIHFPPRVTPWKDSGKEGLAPIAKRFASFILIWRVPSSERKVGIIQWHKLKKENKGIHPVLLQFSLISEIQVKGKPEVFHLMAKKSFSPGSSGKLLSLWLICFQAGLAWPGPVLELGEVLVLMDVTWFFKAAVEVWGLFQDYRLQHSKILTHPHWWCRGSLTASCQFGSPVATTEWYLKKPWGGKGWGDVVLANLSPTLRGGKEGF